MSSSRMTIRLPNDLTRRLELADQLASESQLIEEGAAELSEQLKHEIATHYDADGE
jgi:predicted transcriptional regulator